MTLEVDIINHSTTAGGKQVGLLKMTECWIIIPCPHCVAWTAGEQSRVTLPLSQQITHKIPTRAGFCRSWQANEVGTRAPSSLLYILELKTLWQ